jgi:O-antigen ligase/tetratricopeptide (TPR) repeat protein
MISSNEIGKPAIQETEYQIGIFWGFILGFAFLSGFFTTDTNHFFNWEIDWGIIFVLSTWGIRKKIPFFQSFFFIALSRHVHLDSFKEVGSFPLFYGLSWIIWATAFVSQADPVRASILGFYHAGLSFDPGRVQSHGMGMTLGWDSASLQFFLLAPFLQKGTYVHLLTRVKDNKISIGALVAGLIWVLVLHGGGPTSFFTLRVTCFVACLGLAALSISPKDRLFALSLLIYGAVPIFLCGLGEAFFEGESLTIVFQKRLFTGGLHPNIFASTGAFFLLFLIGNHGEGIFPPLVQKASFAILFLLFLAVLILSGGRGALLVFFLGGLIFCFMKLRKPSLPLIMGATLGILLVVTRTVGSSEIQEWTNNERFYIWKSCLKLICENPWKGHGVFAYGILPQHIAHFQTFFTYDWNYPHTHNLFLELALTGGIPLMVAGGCCFLQSFREIVRKNVGEILVLVIMLLYGMIDLVFFVPSLMSFFLFLLLSFDASDLAKPPSIVKSPRFLNFGFKPLLLLVFGCFFLEGASERAFEKSLALLMKRSSTWVKQGDLAENLQSGNVQISLQRLFLRWATKAATPIQDEPTIRHIQQFFPRYYLPEFLSGRIFMQKGAFCDALTCFSRSVELEPRDTSGLRWAYVALMKKQLGLDYSEDLVIALSRGVLGQSLLLDHPEWGSEFFNTFLKIYPRQNAQAQDIAEEMYRIFSGLTERGDAIILQEYLTRNSQHFPSLKHFEMALDKDFHWPAAVHPEISNIAHYSFSQRKVLMKLAAHHGNFPLFEQIYSLIKNNWVRRNKDAEFWDGLYFSLFFPAQYSIEDGQETINRLSFADPNNPWVQEKSADFFFQKGMMEEGLNHLSQAIKSIATARRDPMFAEGVRPWKNGPTGDQWTVAFEQLFRSMELNSGLYHAQKWAKMETRLLEKYKKLGRMENKKKLD